VWVQNSVSATHDASGRPRYLVVVCQDVTEQPQTSQIKDVFLAARVRLP
jgi:hypothetical protein